MPLQGCVPSGACERDQKHGEVAEDEAQNSCVDVLDTESAARPDDGLPRACREA